MLNENDGGSLIWNHVLQKMRWRAIRYKKQKATNEGLDECEVDNNTVRAMKKVGLT